MPITLAERVLVAALFHVHCCTTLRYAIFYVPAWGMIFLGLYGLRHG